MQPNQWQQQQFGYTPYGSQQQQPGQQRPGGFMASQPTGFPGGAQQQRPMATGMPMQQTGMPGGMGGMSGMGGGMAGMGGMGGMSGMGGSSTPGGGGAGNYSFLNAPPAPGSFGQQRGSGQGAMMSQPTGFGGSGGMMSQPTGMMSQPTGMGGMMSQPTGMGGGLMSQPTGMGGLRAQPTGMHDPRLTTMVQSFMPSNMSQPFSSSGAPQFNQAPSQPLANTFQSLLNNPGVKTPKVPWTLSRQEKKDYDQIFRAWDTRGDGFISGDMAREVFGQSGLSQDDLMKIWNLSDVDNRGKLNLPEFHVAMGLIYRALNGNEIPDKLPDELVPASMRDIDSTVNFMKDLLKHESNTRSDTSSPVHGAYTPMSSASNKDAKVYKHDDSRSGAYKSSARHLDRKAVRYAGEDSGAEISDLRRQLENASGMLDSSSAETTRKTEEDEILEQEVEDIKYRVKRIKEDIDYVSKGRRTTEKDEERRKLEREMLYLMHEKLPEIERRQERRAEEKRMEERAGIRARDRRNEAHGRYDSGRDRDHDWLRGSYERDRSRDDRDRDYGRRGSGGYDRDRYDRDRDSRDYRDSRDRYDDRDRRDDRDRDRDTYGRRGSASARDDSRDRDRDRFDDRDRSERDRNGRSSHDSPRPPSPKKAAPAPAAKKEPAKPATKSLASMTPEERKAYLKEQAQRKIQERMRALGVETSSNESSVDVGVEDRLAQEKKEAEERAKAADAEQVKREEARAARIASARGEAPAAPTAPKDSPSKPPAPPPPKATPKKGPPAPPAPRHGKVPPPAPTPRSAPSAPKPPPSPSKPTPAAEDPEEVELRAQEEARQKAIQERRERLKRLQEEEEEEQRKEEELMAARKARAAAASPPVTTPSKPAPSVTEAPKSPSGSFNPFHRQQPGGAAARSPTAPSFNPFFRPPPVEDPSASTRAPPAAAPPAEPTKQEPAAEAAPPPPPPPPPPAAPTPPPAAAAPAFAPPVRNNSAPPPDDDWEDAREKEVDESDSSDDEYAKSRASRGALASALFGNIMNPGGSRPGTASPPPAPAPPKAPPAALAKLGGGQPAGGGMSALLSSIQGGAHLRKAETNDRSAAAGGSVIGDTAPPAHINAAPQAPPSPPPQPAAAPPAPPQEEEFVPRHDNRSSVDWYSGIAGESPHPAATQAEHALEPTREEEERDVEPPVDQMAAASVSDGPSLDDVDLSRTLHVRTLFDYVSTFDGDLPFKENTVLEAHPAKDPNGPWWFGTLPDGSAGWFPSSYVQESVIKPCRALYDYTAQSGDELSFSEGDPLPVVDQEDPDWWKVERDGAIMLVPAAYVEVIGSRSGGELTQQQQQSNDTQTAPAAGPSQESLEPSKHSNGDARAVATDNIPDTHTTSDALAAPAPVPALAFPIPIPSASPSLSGSSPRQTPSPARIVTSAHVMVNTIAPTPGGASPHDTQRRPAPPPPPSSYQPPHSNRNSLMIPNDNVDAGSASSTSSRRSRGASVSQYSVNDDDDGYASSESDSVMFWSSDEEDAGDTAVAKDLDGGKKEEERKRREVERQKVLEAAGLKIRRPSSSSSVGRRNATRRRRAPPAPPTQKKSNGDAEAPHEPQLATPPPSAPIEIQDAYARYEAFLAESKARPVPPPVQTQVATPAATPTAPAPAGSASGPGSTRNSRPTSFILTELSPSQSTFKEAASTRLTGLLSRIGVGHSTAGDSSSSSKPKISGPIISGPMSGGPMSSPASAEEKGTTTTAATAVSTPDTSDFGKTWSSLVDPSVLETMGDRERKRQEAIFELIATEGTYVRDMQLVVGVFYARVMELLDDKALRVIFANVEDILMFNTFFLSSLEDRQKSCRLYIDTIGDILAEHCQNLEVYMPYCVNQDTARKLLVQLRAENPQLEAALRDVRENNPDVRGLDLSSFLLQPMQRITRYPLLLRQIAHYTDEDQDLGSVQNALACAERTVARINEDVREAESTERLRALSNDLWVGGEGHIDLTAPTAYQGPRKLIKEGAVAKAKSGRRLWLVLCTDVLILIEGTNLYRMPIPLHDLGLQQGRDDVSFAVSVRVPRHEEVRLRAPSNKERIEWVSLITRARKESEAARRSSVMSSNSTLHRRQLSDTMGPPAPRTHTHRRQSSDALSGPHGARRPSNDSYGARRQSSDTLGSFGYAPRPSGDSYASSGGPHGATHRRASSIASAASLAPSVGYDDAMLGLSPPTPSKPRPLSMSTNSDELVDYQGHGQSMHDHQF